MRLDIEAPMISHLYRCIFTHVPKTGGKSVLAAFGLPMLGTEYDGSLTHIENPYGHRPLRNEWKEQLADYFCFAIVRDPLERLASAFFYLDAGGCNRFDAAYRDQHLSVYRGNFLAFVEKLERHIDHDHFRPQSWWLTSPEGVLLPDFIGRYETLQSDFANIASRIGLETPALAHLNASRRPPVNTCYTVQARRKTAEIYAEDFRLLEYRCSIPVD
ncbi:MAG: sulfotransferase family 2 domain-containing protein [Pararhodobacter sp.]|nr:sulfotransferase family 2 domain-containing protein [Pararhodobacter sp.]